jgi:hypothetical protein
MGLQDALNDFKKNNEKEKPTMKNKMSIIMSNQTPKVKKLNYTDEQEEAIEDESGSLKLRAFAGAGKTSTLEGYALRRTGKKGLYISFNRSIKEEAQKRFPKNVKCVTSHGIAYAKFGRDLQHKLMGYTDWKDVYSKTSINKPFGNSDMHNRMYISLLLEAVNLYTNTDSVEISIEQVTAGSYQFMIKNKSVARSMPSPKDIQADAIVLWKAMIDPDLVEIRATHDVYLKQYQLSKPVLKYDYILLDEAQDSNPALLDIFSSQSSNKILVGDPYQSIYGFRNAVDAMNKIETEKTLDLTKSFRFGEQIADFANSILALRGESKQILGMKDSDLVYYGKPMVVKDENSAYIARYNSTLLRNCIEYISMYSFGNVFFAGGFNSLRPDLLLDLYNLKINNGYYIKDVMLASFKDYEEFKEVVTELNDIEWLGRAKLVEEYGNKLPGLITAIKKRETSDISLASKIYSTAHKSKGLEFNNVILAGDYYQTPMEEAKVPDKIYDRIKDSMNEELHVFYVAATRAKNTLNIPENYREYYLDFNNMVHKDLIEKNIQNKSYPVLEKNPDFFRKLVSEREKAKNFYAKKKSEMKNKKDENDIFG